MNGACPPRHAHGLLLAAVIGIGVGMGIGAVSAGEAQAAEPTQRPSAASAEEVEKLYAEGVALYQGRRYLAAVEKFRAAYRLFSEPNLLYNIGRALQAAGDLDGAIENYEACARHPSATNEVRERAEQRLGVLRTAKIASQMAPVDDPLEDRPGAWMGAGASARPVASTSSWMTVAKWVAGGLALGAAAVGTWSTLSGASDHSKLQDAIDTAGSGIASLTLVQAAQLQDDAKAAKTLGVVMFGGAAALTATSALLFVLDREPAKRQLDVGIAPGPDGAWLLVGGRF